MYEVGRKRPFFLFSFFLENEHGFNFEVSALQLIRRLDDVTDGVLVVDAPDFHGGVRVSIDGDKTVDHGDHEVPVDELKQVNLVLGLVLGRGDLDEAFNFKVTQVDLKDGRMGPVSVPGQYNSSGYLLSSRVPHLEYL